MSFYGERREVPQAVRIEWGCSAHPASGQILWVDVARTINSAVKDYNNLHGTEGEPADDAIEVDIRDDEIVFWFTKPVAS